MSSAPMPSKGPRKLASTDGNETILTVRSPRSTLLRVSKAADRAAADIVFVVDTTGSMSDKIEALLRTCGRLAEMLAAKSIDWRIAVVSFGDLTIPGDSIMATPYGEKLKSVRHWLSSIPRNDGGGNAGESSLEAMTRAEALEGSRPGAMRIALLITDEPPLESANTRANATTEMLRRKGVITFTIAPDLPAYRHMAQRTGGRWYRISATTDFTDILEMFERVASDVAVLANDVALQAGGDVKKYLELPGTTPR